MNKRKGDEDKGKEEKRCGRAVSILVLTIGQVSSGLLVPLTQNETKEYSYNPSVVILYSELLKLVLSVAFLYLTIALSEKQAEQPQHFFSGFTWMRLLLSLIPSLAYFITNNLIYEIFKHVDSTTFLVSRSLSILMTAILSWSFLHKKLSDVQWVAVALLALGTMTSQLSTVKRCEGGDEIDNTFTFSLEGYVLCILTSFISASVGIYSETLAKYGMTPPTQSSSSITTKTTTTTPSKDSMRYLYVQNIQIYMWGVVISLVSLLWRFGIGGVASKELLLGGFSWVTWVLVVNYSVVGIATSAVLRFSDSIVKVFTSTAALLITTFLSSFILKTSPSLQVIIGISIVSLSLYLYFGPGLQQQQTTTTKNLLQKTKLS